MSELKLDASGLVTPSVMLGDNVLSSEEDKLIWNGEEIKGSGGHNVGEQWISMDGTIPFGGLAFLGQTVSKETYIELYNWVEANGRFKTEAEWQSLYTANNGNVSFYAKVNDVSFRLPSFKGYLKANESGGGYTKEGLPNITGSAEIPDNVVTNTNSAKIFAKSNGAFHQTTKSSGPRAWATTGISVSTWEDGRNIEFSAQKSNNIYGASSHVTPETNTILIGVYAFNTILNDANVEVDTIRQRIDELESLSKHAVGEQWISMDGTIPAGGVPFNGQILNIADYQALYNWAKDNGRIKTESEWQTLKTNNNSNVAYYSDYSTTQFRMPLFRGYLKADSGSGYIKQGLPNITGSIQANTNDATTAYTGAFYADNTQSGGGDSNATGGFARFDASRSNAIYGRSSNVTPETSKMLVGVYAFNTVVNAAIVDSSQKLSNYLNLSTALTTFSLGYPYGDKSGALLSLRSVNYSDVPGSFALIAQNATNTTSLTGHPGGNLTWDGKQIIRLAESWKNGANWYRKYSDGWIEQGGYINSGSNGSWKVTVSLHKAYTNSSSYNVIVTIDDIDPNGDRTQNCGIGTYSKTSSSFSVAQENSGSKYASWYACGY